MALKNENSQKKSKKTKSKDKREEAVLSAVDLNEVKDAANPLHNVEEAKKSKKRKKETKHDTKSNISSDAARHDGDGSSDGLHETKDERKSKKGKKGKKDEHVQPIVDSAEDHEGDAGAQGEPEEVRISKEGKKEKRTNLGQSKPASAAEENNINDYIDTGRDLADERKVKKKKARKDKWGQPIASATDEHDFPAKTVRQPSKFNQGTEGQVAKTYQYEPKKVVISGMPYTTTEDEIRDLFKDVGTIVQMQLSRFPDSGNFRGLAFITFPNEEIAAKALAFDGTEMGNRFVKVERCRWDPQKSKNEFAEEPQKVEGSYSVYVGNLSWEVTEDDIRNFFCDSKIETVRLAVNKKTGKFRGFCHVDFTDDESLELAVSKNQTELQGRKVKVSYAVSNKD